MDGQTDVALLVLCLARPWQEERERLRILARLGVSTGELVQC